MAAGRFFSLALRHGAVLAWGDNRYEQTELPEGTHSGISAIAAGAHHALALRGDPAPAP
ncbi:RCC1-like domain-containing protein [Streptomyces sp. NPDC102395]|uniref:RCC1-like domain-containing protein n=1 Tax=Streptomyces sp. NPDC102395 TaxID=3366168 RepID=UPI0037FBEAC1